MTRVQKVGLIVILLPALSVVAVSVFVEVRLHPKSGMSLWQHIAPFAANWGIGLALVAVSLLFLKWLAGRDREHDKSR